MLLLASSAAQGQFCAGPYTSSNETHVTAGRAAVATTTDCSACFLGICSVFCPGTTLSNFSTVGANEALGSSGASVTTLYESPAGSFSTAPCGPTCSPSETACADGADDDCDGAIDCADSDCFSATACDTCNNGICESARAEDPDSCPEDCGVGTNACPVDYDSISAAPGSFGSFTKFNLSGVQSGSHNTVYHYMGRTDPVDGMQDRDVWMQEMKERLDDVIVAPWRDNPNVVQVGTAYSQSWGGHGQARDVAAFGNTFPLYAMADGVVVWVGYHPSTGNVVIMEYAMPSGERFRSIYHHVRDGRDKDITRALWTKAYCKGKPCEIDNCSYLDADGKKDAARCTRWKQYPLDAKNAQDAFADADADNDAPFTRQWGTNDQVILVTPGQSVVRGQQIGWAGDTGADSDGVHLHFRTARPATHMVSGAPISLWTLFDVTGLYSSSAECYELGYPSGSFGSDPRQHDSLLAPLFHVFADAKGAMFQAARSYYARHGMGVSTLATELGGAARNEWRYAGGFSSDVDTEVRAVMSFDSFQSTFTSMWNDGFVPSQVSVEDLEQTTYTALYERRQGGYWMSHKMTPAWVNTRSAELGSGYGMVDYVPYVENGQLLFSAAWKEGAGPAVPVSGMSRAVLDNYASVLPAYGFKLVRTHRYAHPTDGIRYTGLWRSDHPGNTAHYEFTDANLMQDWTLFMEAFGGRLLHLSADSGVYNVLYEF